MMKWLRAHSKQIMVVVVLLAMFSFIGGSALTNFLSPHPGTEKFARAFGGTLTGNDLVTANQDTDIYERIGMPWKQFGGSKELTYIHWYLLSREADEAGIVVPDEEVETQIQAARIPERIAGLPRNQYSLPNIRKAVGRWMAVMKNAQRVLTTAAPSEPQVRNYVHDTEEKVRVKFVALDAQSFVDPLEPLSEAELQAQFDKYRNNLAGEGESGFGYKYPDRVRIEYIAANARQIAPQLTISDEDIKSHWKQNKAKYTITEKVPAPATSSPTTSSAPASAPAEQTVTREKIFSEARADVERELRDARAEKRADEAMREAANEVLKPWFDHPTDPETGYKPIPEAVKDPNFMRDVRDRIAIKYGITLDFATLGLMSKTELSANPVAQRVMTAGGRNEQLGMAEYAFRVPGIYVPEKNAETIPHLQLYQTPDTPLSSGDIDMEAYKATHTISFKKQRLVLFRVVEVRPSAAPTTLVEVRPLVERDVRQQRAFERMSTTVREFYATARRVGLDQALQSSESIRAKTSLTVPASPPAFARKTARTLGTPPLPGLGTSPEFVDACFAMAAPDWAPTEPVAELPSSAPASTQPAPESAPKVGLVSLPQMRKWAVVEFVGLDPVRDDTYDQTLRKQAYKTLEEIRSGALRTAWFDQANIEKRCGFERLREGERGLPHHGIEPEAPPVF